MKKRRIDKLIFIDRDGVINEDPIDDYVKRWEDFKFLPGVLHALKQLNIAGYKIIIVSNQAGVGDGVYSKRALKQITKNMLNQMKEEGIKIQGIHYCLHGKRAGCACRKPKTGLFQQATRQILFNKEHTFFIGDKLSDVKSGKKFGLKTILVLTGHGEIHLRKYKSRMNADFIVQDLRKAVRRVLNRPK